MIRHPASSDRKTTGWRALTLGLVLSTAFGCAGAISSASIEAAHKEFDRGHYAKTLRLIQRAQNWGELTDDKRAEFAYLKARSLEHQGDASAARQLYRYLLEQHPTSEYAYLAERRDQMANPAASPLGALPSLPWLSGPAGRTLLGPLPDREPCVVTQPR